jgi:single-strand DNA-binding protein
MNDLQCWFATGTLVEDARLKFTPSGFPILDFELSSQRTYVVKDQPREERLTASCTILGDLGKQLAPSLKAGARVMVRGRWKLSEWTDQKTGQPRKRHVVTVDECSLLTSIGETSGAPSDAVPDGMPF